MRWESPGYLKRRPESVDEDCDELSLRFKIAKTIANQIWVVKLQRDWSIR
jgi:hypothetical protein